MILKHLQEKSPLDLGIRIYNALEHASQFDS